MQKPEKNAYDLRLDLIEVKNYAYSSNTRMTHTHKQQLRRQN